MIVMKTLLFFYTACAVFLSTNLFPQNKLNVLPNGFEINLNFDETAHKDKQSGFVTVRDYFDFTDASQTGKFKLPSKTFLISIPPDSKPEIIISDQQNEIIKSVIPSLQPKLKSLNDSTFVYEEVSFSNAVIEPQKNSPLEIIGYGWYRDNYCVQVRIYTHTFDVASNQINRIKSLKLSVLLGSNYPISLAENINSSKDINRDIFNKAFLNYEIADQFKSQHKFSPNDVTGDWINYSAEYLKIGTASDGIFRITKSDLETFGVSTISINPKTFRLIESGKEIPIIVFGQEDEVFDDADYIQFFGTMNYSDSSYRIINSPSADYHEYLNRYTDTTFYFLTWGFEDGLRAPIQNSFTAGLTDTLDYYNYFEHTESNKILFSADVDEFRNQTPGWLKNKTWYYHQSEWLYSNTSRNYNFDAFDVVPKKNAKFYYKAVSGGSEIVDDAHQVILKVNGVLLDSQSVNRNDQVILSGSLNTNLFQTNPNVLNVKNYSNSTTVNFLAVDWYDVEYPRTLKLNDDQLLFTLTDDVTSGLKVVKIQNALSSSFEIYKVEPFLKKIENYLLTSNQILFTDTVHSGDKYIIVSTSKTSKPVFYYKKQFINLRSISSQADYVAITHQKFLSSAQNYVSEIASMYDLTTNLYLVQDIYDEFGFGYSTPESIRSFLIDTYERRVEPKPAYLTLIGDADYDYKLYRFKSDGVIGGGNYVPSFGSPVSDNWFVIWDDQIYPLPQLMVGRIPVNTSEELDYYLTKVQTNFNSKFDEWNKHYLFFTGGRSDFPDEIAQLKNTNDQVINNFVQPPPLSGSYTHFYKTTNPQSDFGPYTPEQFTNAIDQGGVFISYLGHSGTATWDNSISETIQLKNTVGRTPLITDFGCSTNKFAEPDIIAFGERFCLTSDGQAIGYIGNSSLGFTSTSLSVPILFYETILSSVNNEVGDAHLTSKLKMFEEIGTSTVYKIFASTNCLIGDPTIRIKVPGQPNLKISNSDVLLTNQFVNDYSDSTLINIVVNNFGTEDTSDFNYSIQHFALGNLVEEFTGHKVLPPFQDTLKIWVKTKNLAGQHSLNINLDSSNEIEEIYEDDNSVSFNFYIYSSALRDLLKHRIENSAITSLQILNPSVLEAADFKLQYQISEFEDFRTNQEFTIPADSFLTEIDLSQLLQNKRYFIRYKLDDPNSVYSNTVSFFNSGDNDFLLIDSASFNYQSLNDLSFSNSKLSIAPGVDNISVTSAGFEAGATCVIAKNGINLLSNTFFAGMGIVVFDEITLDVDTSAYYNLFNNLPNMQLLVDLINSIPEGKVVAMGVSDDAANNITSALKTAIKTLGSTKIDSLVFRGSWALIGKKGAAPGDVLEVVHGRYDGLIFIDSNFVVQKTNGTFETADLGPSTNWQNITVDQNIQGGNIVYSVFGIDSTGISDSLAVLNLSGGSADLSFIDSKTYPKIKIKSEFTGTTEGISPEINSLGINYTGLPELGTNFQVTSLVEDSILAGGSAELNFWIYNAGDADAENFNVKVELVNEDNSVAIIKDELINSLSANSRRKFTVNYQTAASDTQKRFVISIDPDQNVEEYFEDNNFFTKTLYFKNDIVPPDIKITFDDIEVFNGDFVSSEPKIKIALSDDSPLPITDTTSLKIYLNEIPIYYNGNSSVLNYTTNSSNPKFIAEYNPKLSDGEYLLRIAAKDLNGNFSDSASSEVHFLVSSDAKLLYVYNYPNPFADETYFTFKLTQIPDEFKIKIFTVAGRLIKEFSKSPSELNFDFNRIYWDGRDEDGDLIANGVYFYKVIMKKDEKIETTTQKIAVVR